ncbi:MAG: hypothetical protein LC808_32730 [Actinobacteria bacterium]|nr:hypothetical protein [Actinomycetota bacterium]
MSFDLIIPYFMKRLNDIARWRSPQQSEVVVVSCDSKLRQVSEVFLVSIAIHYPLIERYNSGCFPWAFHSEFVDQGRWWAVTAIAKSHRDISIFIGTEGDQSAWGDRYSGGTPKRTGDVVVDDTVGSIGCVKSCVRLETYPAHPARATDLGASECNTKVANATRRQAPAWPHHCLHRVKGYRTCR